MHLKVEQLCSRKNSLQLQLSTVRVKLILTELPVIMNGMIELIRTFRLFSDENIGLSCDFGDMSIDGTFEWDF